MSISAPRDCTGSTRAKNKKENAHVSPGTEDERITSRQASDDQSTEGGGALPDKVPGEYLFDNRAHRVLNGEKVLSRERVHDYYCLEEA